MLSGDVLSAQASKTGSIDALVSFIDTIKVIVWDILVVTQKKESVSTAQLIDDSVTNQKIVDDIQFNSVTC